MKPEQLAKKTVEEYIKKRKLFSFSGKLEGVNVERAGTFVSIKTTKHELRGCIGTIFPTEDSVKQEIINNAIAASTRDPRFYPITEQELDNLKYSVDILSEPILIKNISELNPKIFGIIVTSETGKQGVLLPDLEGVDTIELQIEICKQKAGIHPNEKILIKKFKVDRYSEP